MKSSYLAASPRKSQKKAAENYWSSLTTDRKQLFRALARNVTPKAEGTKAAREISVASSQDQDHVSASHRLAPLDFLADYLGEKLKAVTMICQDPVTDKDFLAEYEAFYSKTFMNYDKKCKRLHFFSIFPNENESALDFLDRASSLAKTSNIYLGFVTLRPIRTCPIGPTIIAPGEDCRYLKVCDKFLVTISGAEFSIEGTPFLQQDSSVGACVQASLWMALRVERLTNTDNSNTKTAATTTCSSKERVCRSILWISAEVKFSTFCNRVFTSCINC